MAIRTKVNNKLNVVVGTKAQILGDNTIPENSIIITTDESPVIVGASYDNDTKDITFTLENGETLVVPLDDLVEGLANETWVTQQINNIDTKLDIKVDKVVGKGLSTEDYTTTEKNKLSGIKAGAEVNVQSDWNITDTANDGFIKNKPAIKTVATTGNYNDLTNKPDLTLKLDKNFSALPTQANPLLTDVLVSNRGTTVQKVTLGSLLAQIDTELFIVVSTLPTTGVANKIYLVPSSEPKTRAPEQPVDNFVEWLWYDGAWERLGGFTLDLSNYFNKTEINSMLKDKVDKNANITAGTSPKITYDAKGLVTGGSDLVASDIPPLAISKVTNLQSSLDNKVDKIEGKGLSTNDYTNADKQSVEKIPTIEQGILDLESDKVDKVSGMGLSSNDFTTTEKNKLSGIQTGAQVNTVTTVAGRTGAVVLTKADVGLGNVDNTSDGTKYVQGLRETRANVNTKIWTGTEAQYDAIVTKDATTLYFITE